MTVLHVAAGNGYGGIERMLVTLAATPHPSLAQRFVVAFAGRLEDELTAAGASPARLPSPRASRPLMIWRSRRAFVSVLHEIRPDALIFHGAWPHAMFAAVAQAEGIPVGFWQHQPIARPSWPDRWARRVRPAFVVFNSAFTGARPAFDDVPGRVIHCPVPALPSIGADERREMRRVMGAGDEDVVVLMAARMERWKGHEVLLRAAGRVTGARVRVWIAGGPQRPVESAYAEELGRTAAALDGRVSVLGERSDVPRLMRLADIYCQPNLKGEPFGIAIAEAMRGGLPCVVSAAGGAAELLDDTCAIVTAPGDVDAVASALERLAGDHALREAMGQAAAARAAALTDPAGRLDELAALVAEHAAAHAS